MPRNDASAAREHQTSFHVCFLSNQVAAFGKIGGFGTGVRALGAELVRRGHQVTVVVPRQASQPADTMLDGMRIIGCNSFGMAFGVRPLREINADIYHSHEPTWQTVLAQWASPAARHVVTSIDPRPWREILIELRHATLSRRLLFPRQWFYEFQPLIKHGVRQSHLVLTPAPTFLSPLTAHLYKLTEPPTFAPTAYVPKLEARHRKASRPTFIFVGRWDRRKRVELFFDIARNRPQYSFIAVGRAHEEAEDRRLRNLAHKLPNVEVTGFLSVFDEDLWDNYDRAWALVNTSAREGLPLTFFEALSRGCLIASFVDPERLASRFGRRAESDDLDSILNAVDAIANIGPSSSLSQLAASYAQTTYGIEAMADRHEDLYHGLVENS